MKHQLITLLSATIIASCASSKEPIKYTSSGGGSNQQQQGQPKGPMSIDDIFKMDVDKDGFLSKTEVKGPIANDFDKIDTNGDGLISRVELEKAPKPDPQGGQGQRPPRQ